MDQGVDERAVYEADMEAFEDHWGWVPLSFESWSHEVSGVEGFDPSLVPVAMDGAQVVGWAWCRTETPRNTEGGYVEVLGVRRPWRRRGIGLGLLHWCFGEMWRRGYRRVTIGVDTENPTGALQLYERAGMHTFREWIEFEKVLAAQ
jgi:ribosomal protein S18 acetylase RimI-like enzyme